MPQLFSALRVLGRHTVMKSALMGQNRVPIWIHGHIPSTVKEFFLTDGRDAGDGIEGFWGLAKVRMTQFKCLPKNTFSGRVADLADETRLAGASGASSGATRSFFPYVGCSHDRRLTRNEQNYECLRHPQTDLC